MPGDDANAPKEGTPKLGATGAPEGRRGAPIRTAPLSDSGSLREALQAQLQQAVAPSLTVVAGPDVGLRVRLDRSVEIGRDPGAAVPLRDESISWRHVRVEDRGAGDWACVDLGSTNGLLVNGERASGALLRRGDKIVLGKTILEFQLADPIRDGFDVEMQRLINEDELSGLWVRRRFDSQLETTIKAIEAGSLATVSVVVMDLDGVKTINDTHGHDMGAFVIGEAGHVIGRALVGPSFATRFGGDEFCAALPGTGRSEAIAWAELARVKVTEHVYERGGVRVAPGMSCGVASVPGDATDAAGVFRAADQAMYRAKRSGKNRVST